MSAFTISRAASNAVATGDETRGVEKPRTGDDDGRESERRRGKMMRARGLSTLDGIRTVHVAHGGVSADVCRTRWLRV
jgi:hypothetical protein